MKMQCNLYNYKNENKNLKTKNKMQIQKRAQKEQFGDSIRDSKIWTRFLNF